MPSFARNSGGVSAEKFSQGMMLFNLLKNPSLEISEAYPINELDVHISSELKAYYTKYGYYFDNIIEECKGFIEVNEENDAKKRVRMINIALQFLIKKAFFAVTEMQANKSFSEKNELADKIESWNLQLKAVLADLKDTADNVQGRLFDNVVYCLERTRQMKRLKWVPRLRKLRSV